MKQKLLVFATYVFAMMSVGAQELSQAAREANYTRDTVSLEVAGTSTLSTGNVQATSVAASASTEVGQTPGELSVSSTGGAAYTVPIAVPPGINGVEPDIALTYSSQGGNGLAGWGWNISGVSVITRIPSTEFHDDQTAGVDFTATDRFALDGQRLLLKSGTYGKNGAVYETENYSNMKITSHGTSPYGAAYGPAYFEVTQPDGSVAVYGSSNNSRSRTDYAIRYWENPQGIRISYNYVTSGNGLSIKTITYGSKGSAASINEIEFVYDNNRTRREQAYIGGISFVRSNILSEIKVKGNGVGYRNYVLSHSTTSLGYQRLTGIQEKSGDGTKSYDPIIFNYTNSSKQVVVAEATGETTVTNLEQRNAAAVSGDFTGNGKMDFIVYPTYGSDSKKLFWLFSNLQDGGSGLNSGTPQNVGLFQEIFPISYISDISSVSNRLPSKQGLVIIKHSGRSDVNFEIYGEVSSTSGSVLGNQYTKNWESPSYTDFTGEHAIPKTYISGDFNGDGLSDVVTITKPYSYYPCHPREGPECDNSVQVNRSAAYLVELDHKKSSGFAALSGTFTKAYEGNDKLLTADVIGDGKTNILHVTDGKVYVYGLDENDNLELLWETSNNRIDKDLPLLFGDYNGDGKTDFITPKEKDSNEFTLFLSTGKSHVPSNHTYPFEYKETNYNDNGSTLFGYNLIPVDINGDGRTDILDHRTTTYTGSSNGTQKIRLYSNLSPSGTAVKPAFSYSYSKSKTGKLENYPIPVFLSSSRPNGNLDFATISNKWVTSFQFLKDHREDVKLRSVVNNGVKEAITYSPLDPMGIPQVYTRATQPSKLESYPYTDIEASQGTQVVSKLERSGTGLTTIQQQFSYHGAVTHATGLGFLGFKKLTRSNWHKDYSDRIYSTSYHSPQLRGAVTKEFTSRNTISEHADFIDESPSSSHVTLSSATTGTKTATQSVSLKPGFSANGSNGTFVARTDQDTGISDGASSPTDDYISRTDYKYSTQTRSNKVFVNVPVEVATKDLLNDTRTFKTYSYDSYKNLTKEYTNYSGKGTRTVTMTYVNSTGTTYYIGRPTKKVERQTAYGNTYTTEERYEKYENYLPQKIRSKGHGTDFMIEERVYDGLGNITEKSITPPDGSASRVTSYTYDDSGRFLETAIDVEGLETSYAYNPDNGNLKEETNPYGQTTTYTYDPWGKVINVKDYRGNTVTTIYAKSGNQSTVTETGNDGSSKVSVYDMLGQLVRVKEKNVMGQWVEKAIKYDHRGRKIEESEPFIGGVSQWNTTEYDLYGRVKRTTSHTGKVTNISYNGLTTTVNDGTKTVTTTKDALDNVSKVTDPGGTVNYTYYANGNLKTADYGGSVQRMEQDGWGRKTKLIDPSAGTYTYAYNGFGETTKETTPKGTTTYSYNDKGILTGKTLEGEHTDMQWTYNYDNDTKLPKATTLTNADGNNTTYVLDYNTNHPQLVRKIVETNPHAIFTREYTYDGFNRVNTEKHIAKNRADNKTSTKTIKNDYQNGALKSIADNSTQEVLWEVSEVNARGQITEAALGETLKEVNTYDQYGFPTERKTQKVSSSGTTNLVTLDYDFNPQRGILNSRTNSMFNWSETFEYDNQDRLTHFNDNSGDNSQIYDSRGRITKNSALGDYEYSGISYQNTKITVDEEALIPGSTEAARQYYQNHPQQNITYNAFKSPVQIHEQGKERISFQYNASLGRSHMYYGGQQSDKMQRRYRKHYSADGSMEIKEDTQTGKTTFITYIGGDAYSAPLIWHSEKATTTTENYYYLHRDYLGSILGITDKNGNFKEKRHFDAWGNIVKLTNGAGTALTNFTILDRGYTGHEHLLSLSGVQGSLIHMNGRLYDPVMHRFLMPDNYVQDPFNTQNFNRYGYVLNNPLMYVDQNGEFFVGLIPLVVAMVKGAAIAVAVNGISNLIQGQGFFKGAGSSALFGAISAGIAYGVGEASSAIASSFGPKASSLAVKLTVGAFQAGAHALAGGTMTAIQGGKFGHGALGGAIGSAAASAVGGSVKEGFWRDASQLVAAAFSGGAGSAISGGDFWQGFQYGAISATVNHLTHKLHEGWRRKMARRLAIKYIKNKNKIIAYSIAAESLLEITEFGDFVTNMRESFIETYGDYRDKNINEVYGNMIEIAKTVKSSIGSTGKVTDAYIYKTSAAFALKATSLGAQNASLAPMIKKLDMGIYVHYKINPFDSDIPQGGRMGGGGASGGW